MGGGVSLQQRVHRERGGSARCRDTHTDMPSRASRSVGPPKFKGAMYSHGTAGGPSGSGVLRWLPQKPNGSLLLGSREEGACIDSRCGLWPG